jgi:thiol:disulfide interchange protein
MVVKSVKSDAELDRELTAAGGRLVVVDFWATCVGGKEGAAAYTSEPKGGVSLIDCVVFRGDRN